VVPVVVFGGSWASRRRGGVSAFSHLVAPGVHESRPATEGGVTGRENGCLWFRVGEVKGMSYAMRAR